MNIFAYVTGTLFKRRFHRRYAARYMASAGEFSLTSYGNELVQQWRVPASAR